MSRANQFRFNFRCVLRDLASFHLNKALFHLRGLMRAILP
jgi:hypothetical protein